MAASDKSVAVSFTTEFSSESTVSDGWHELTKSDYAKVIFSDLLCNAASGTVECKFQITDNVHEDPNDYVGLFRIGYEDLSQCLVSKMLSQTKCEDDGKLQRCVFTANELPYLDDSFYQFLYVTRDQEVCGASMPFLIKMSPSQLKENPVESGSPERMDSGFLLVSNQTERKVTEEPNELKETSTQRSTLSEQKKEEIAAWVSQNPDYYSLVEQIKEHTFTIDALQQSKDLAMKEVAQLYEVLNKQNEELLQLRNMLAAYEEKIKMSQKLQEEKTTKMSELEKSASAYEEKLKTYEVALEKKDKELSHMQTEYCLSINNSHHLKEKQQAEIDALKKELEEAKDWHDSQRCDQINRLKNVATLYDGEISRLEDLNEKKDEQLSLMKREHEASIKESLNCQDKLRAEIGDLRKELEKIQEIEKAKWRPVTGKKGLPMENLVQRAQDLARFLSETITNLDFTDEEEMEKFFQFKIQLLIIESKLTRATELANVCDRNGLNKQIHSIMDKDVKRNSISDSSSCLLENRDPFLTNTNVPEAEKLVIPIPSAEVPNLPHSNEKDPPNNVVSKEVVQRIERTFKKVFDSEGLDHQIIELPRLDVIKKDAATVRTLDEEDVAVINRLTENIIKRGANLYEAIELGDDSSSDSGSDVSENSDCPSYIKKNLICVGRVMEALSSSLATQTSLEQLVVVENEEDKNLICRKEWDVLLQKCALHYQIEILLEHIEKQKDGMKKVSEKFCELLTQYMLLKDEVRDSKQIIENLEGVIDNKDMHIAMITGDLEFKDDLLSHFCSEKEGLEMRAELAEKTVEDFRARIMEASDLYKKQFTQIGKLSRKLQKYKSLKGKSKSSKRELTSTSTESSKTTSSFEVIPTNSVQNVNDSDTGEHMFEKTSLVSNEKNRLPRSSSFSGLASQPFVISEEEKLDHDDAAEELQFPRFEVIQAQLNSDKEIKTDFENLPGTFKTSENTFDDYLSDTGSGIYKLNSEHSIPIETSEKPVSETIESRTKQAASTISDFQEVLKEYFSKMKKPAASRNSQLCSTLCFFCKQLLSLDLVDPSDLMNHFENEHSIKICPICGHMFEDAVPSKYFQIHVDKHFETE